MLAPHQFTFVLQLNPFLLFMFPWNMNCYCSERTMLTYVSVSSFWMNCRRGCKQRKKSLTCLHRSTLYVSFYNPNPLFTFTAVSFLIKFKFAMKTSVISIILNIISFYFFNFTLPAFFNLSKIGIYILHLFCCHLLFWRVSHFQYYVIEILS